MRTKAAKAAKLAVQFKNQAEQVEEAPTPKKTPGMNKTATAMNETAISSTGGSEELKKVKELEKRVVKLR